MEKTIFNPEKMYTYIRGFASALHMEQTLKALTFARKKTSRSIEKKRRTLYCSPSYHGLRRNEYGN